MLAVNKVDTNWLSQVDTLLITPQEWTENSVTEEKRRFLDVHSVYLVHILTSTIMNWWVTVHLYPRPTAIYKLSILSPKNKCSKAQDLVEYWQDVTKWETQQVDLCNRLHWKQCPRLASQEFVNCFPSTSLGKWKQKPTTIMAHVADEGYSNLREVGVCRAGKEKWKILQY